MVIRMRKVIVMSKFLMYLQRATPKYFGYAIVSRNAENRFLTEFWRWRFSRIAKIGKGIDSNRDRVSRRWIFEIFEVLGSSGPARKKILKDFERFSGILKAI